MNPNTRCLHAIGQSLWLDNISRRLLRSGALGRYIAELAVSGLTLNPTIFERAIEDDDSYDAAIHELAAEGLSGEDIFFRLALDDLTEAADLFYPIHQASQGLDGWVCIEVSPLLANDTDNSIKAVRQLHVRAARPNLMMQIPGTAAGLPAIEQSIADGIPVNITLLFSREHYWAAADAYMRGIERRISAGLDPGVTCVASIFVNPWDKAVTDKVPDAFQNRLGIAIAMRIYKAHRDLLSSKRWQKLAATGARPQRLLWTSTETTDPAVPDILYVEALAAPTTIVSLTEQTLFAFADHGKVDQATPIDEGYAEAVIAEFTREGINDEALAADLQNQGRAAFAKTWGELLYRIAAKSELLTKEVSVGSSVIPQNILPGAHRVCVAWSTTSALPTGAPS
jgi:transaldolase